MERKQLRNTISAFVIVLMIASVFALPVLNDDYAVNAAAKKVKITYNKNGGKFSAKKYSKKSKIVKKVKKNKKRGTAPSIKKTGYKLKGWYTKKKGGKKYTKKTKIKKSVKLYAQWTANKYTVTFDSQGGSAIAPKKVTFNGTYGELPNLISADGIFEGWYTAATGGEKVDANTVYKTAKNTTLYARWIKFGTGANELGKQWSEIVSSSADPGDIKIKGSLSMYMNDEADKAYIFKDNICILNAGRANTFFPGKNTMTQAQFELETGLANKGIYIHTTPAADSISGKVQDTYSYLINGYYLFITYQEGMFCNDENYKAECMISAYDYQTINGYVLELLS